PGSLRMILCSQTAPNVSSNKRIARYPVSGNGLSDLLVYLVGDTGIEPVTSSVSGKRSPAELIAQVRAEVETGFEPVYTALQAVASPLGHSTNVGRAFGGLRADDGTRTRDPHLGKVMRYQLRYVRMPPEYRLTNENSSPARRHVPNRIPGAPHRAAKQTATRSSSTAATRDAAVPGRLRWPLPAGSRSPPGGSRPGPARSRRAAWSTGTRGRS